MEFAIVVPILLAIVFAVVDFGRALWTVNVATSALREGARTAAAQVSAASCAAAAATASARVTSYLQTAGFSTTGVTVSAGCDAATSTYITVCYGSTATCNATASNRFPFTTIAPAVSRLVLTNGVKVAPAVFRWEKS